LNIEIEGLMPFAGSIRRSLRFSLDKKLTILIGPNMTGKTRIMYSIWFAMYLLYWTEKEEINKEGVESLWREVFMISRDEWFKVGRKEYRVKVSGKKSLVDVSIAKGGVKRVQVNPLKGRSAPPYYLLVPGIGEYYRLVLYGDTGLRVSKSRAFTYTLNQIMLGIPEGEKVSLGDNIRFFTRQGDVRIERRIPGYKRVVDYSILTEATGLKNLAFVSFLKHIMSPGSVILLDEPEAGLHPSFLKIMGQMIISMANKGKVWISTHSPMLLDVINYLAYEGRVSWEDIQVVYITRNGPPDFKITEVRVDEVSAQSPISAEPLLVDSLDILAGIWEKLEVRR